MADLDAFRLAALLMASGAKSHANYLRVQADELEGVIRQLRHEADQLVAEAAEVTATDNE